MNSDDPLAAVRGIRNGLIITIAFFWTPLIFLIAWLVNR